jgi:SAM-dependent methyltransferase
VSGRLLSSFRREGLVGILKRSIKEVEEIRFDRKFGIETRSTWTEYSAPVGYDRNLYIPYGPTKISALTEIFHELPIMFEDFVFVDIGSGKGRALLVASEFPFRRIIGVEFSPELHSIAKKNIRAYRSQTQKCKVIESNCCDATLYQMPRENTVLFLYNPFKGPIISRLLTNLRESLRGYPRQLYLVYHNPVCHNLIMQSGFLEAVRVLKSGSIYKNRISAVR